MNFGWLKYLEPLARPAVERLAKWLFNDDGKGEEKGNTEAARLGAAAGEAARRASREAGPKKDDQ